MYGGFEKEDEAELPSKKKDAKMYVDFVKSGYKKTTGKKIPDPVFIEQWFTTHDFKGLDGKIYRGATL